MTRVFTRGSGLSILFFGLLTSPSLANDTVSSTSQNPLLIPLVLLCALLLLIMWLQLRTRRNLHGLQQLTDSMIDAMTALVIGVDANGTILEVNRSAAEHLGKSKSELVGYSFFELFDQLPIAFERLEQVLTHRSPLRIDKVRENSSDRTWNVLLTPWYSRRQPSVVIRLDEISDQVQREGMMVQQDKLLTVSRLTVGMIHEINNPLASILQNMQVIHNRLSTQLQKNRLAADSCGTSMENIAQYLHERGIDTAIESVRESARRAARVIENLVNFTRQDEENEAFHSLSELLERAVELASSDFDLKQHYDFRQIQLERRFDSNVPPVRCRALKLQQAFFALMRFRAEKMLATGDSPHLMTLRLSCESDQALIQLEDNGPQLAEEERRNLFRPSHTDPENSLALCVCHFIICQIHGGTISIETVENGSSRIGVRIPVKRPAYE